MKRKIRLYALECTGAIIIAFAIMAPVIVGSAGMALDFAQAYLVQQRLTQALDASALAAAASSTDAATIEQKVKDFFAANYPPEKLGITFEPRVVVNGDEVIVTGTAQYNTFFLRLIGIDSINVSAATTVQRQIQGLEVAMVLDNTGSMATNNNIGTLKTATRNFINILFDHAKDPEDVRIALVPYSNSVRVGRYGLGKKPDNTNYNDGTVFVQLPSGISYTNTHNDSSNWYGCITEHKSTNYNSAATHVAGSRGQLWRTGSGSGCNSATNCRGHGWAPGVTNNDSYPNDIEDEYAGPWDIYAYGRVILNGQKCSDFDTSSYDFVNTAARCSACTGSGGKCAASYCFCTVGTSGSQDDGPNTGCPYAYVVPLTSDQTYLLSQVDPDTAAEPDDMEPHGHTMGNVGMLWGYKILSPEEPFTEGEPWDDEYWKKAVVMMTDGDNTLENNYTYFWDTHKNNITVTDLNERFVEVCEALKDKGVVIYTITFTSSINDDTKQYYEDCASSEDQYFDAPTQEELLDAFEQIANELANLYIKN
ncbi:MAG: pilus assembly protein TadG-related protein [Alphaproteobacteria bacterium]